MRKTIGFLVLIVAFFSCQDSQTIQIDCSIKKVYTFEAKNKINDVTHITLEVLQPCCKGSKVLFSEIINTQNTNIIVLADSIRNSLHLEAPIDYLGLRKDSDWYSRNFSILHDGNNGCKLIGKIKVTVL